MPERPTDAAASDPQDATAEAEAETPTETPEAESRLTPQSQTPEYKGEPLDAERGPGLGCFWIQVALLTFFLVFTPLTVTWGWDPTISAILLIITLILLLLSGQTIIFLLRLVAADRRARRAPLSPSAKPTVGQMEDADAALAGQDEATPAASADDRSGGHESKGGD